MIEQKYYIWNKEKRKMSETIKLSILSVSWMIVGIAISLTVIQLNLHLPEFAQSKLIDNNCNQTDLFVNAKCLNNQLRQWWFYNISSLGKELNLDELKLDGGTCYHASLWYLDNINTSLFYAEKITIKINESMYHAFTVMSNNQGWCALDQENIECFKFEVKDE